MRPASTHSPSGGAPWGKHLSSLGGRGKQDVEVRITLCFTLIQPPSFSLSLCVLSSRVSSTTVAMCVLLQRHIQYHTEALNILVLRTAA